MFSSDLVCQNRTGELAVQPTSGSALWIYSAKTSGLWSTLDQLHSKSKLDSHQITDHEKQQSTD